MKQTTTKNLNYETLHLLKTQKTRNEQTNLRSTPYKSTLDTRPTLNIHKFSSKGF